jgi:hypothetical protein
MAEQGVATAEPGDEIKTEHALGPVTASRERKGEDIEYEVGFDTPFGKLEFEIEPRSLKKQRDARRKERAAREAQRATLLAARKAEEQAIKAEKRRSRAPFFFAVLLVLVALAALIALAVWLFARPGDDDESELPPELRSDADAAEPQGVFGRLKRRVTAGIREGKKASREAQEEQRRKFEEMAGR